MARRLRFEERVRVEEMARAGCSAAESAARPLFNAVISSTL